ncbi:MAG: hypothetical protein QM786_12495 [Breznakibacter sp.]
MKKIIIIGIITVFVGSLTYAQQQPTSTIPYQSSDSMMITVVLRHIQENPVDTIQTRVMKQKFYEKLSQSRSRILSWNVVMGIGQIITLRTKAENIREINQVFESGAWGGFTTEFYLTYDFLPIYPVMQEREEKAARKRIIQRRFFASTPNRKLWKLVLIINQKNDIK